MSSVTNLSTETKNESPIKTELQNYVKEYQLNFSIEGMLCHLMKTAAKKGKIKIDINLKDKYEDEKSGSEDSSDSDDDYCTFKFRSKDKEKIKKYCDINKLEFKCVEIKEKYTYKKSIRWDLYDRITISWK
jgi:hypothetical protein